jgi:protease I
MHLRQARGLRALSSFHPFPEHTIMSKNLKGKHVAILATDGFEHSELTEPRKALQEAGAQVSVVSPHSGRIRSWVKADWGDEVDVDLELSAANAEDFDALVLPGGPINPDHLRVNKSAISFIRDFADSKKPIAAICHGPWTLIEVGAVKGRRVTSWPSLQTDLRNAGANWVDEEVVVDQGLVTSRKPDDLPAFNRKMIEEIAEGVHERRKPAERGIKSHSHPATG